MGSMALSSTENPMIVVFFLGLSSHLRQRSWDDQNLYEAYERQEYIDQNSMFFSKLHSRSLTFGILLSFWDGIFSGAMFNFQGVIHQFLNFYKERWWWLATKCLGKKWHDRFEIAKWYFSFNCPKGNFPSGWNEWLMHFFSVSNHTWLSQTANYQGGLQLPIAVQQNHWNFLEAVPPTNSNIFGGAKELGMTWNLPNLGAKSRRMNAGITHRYLGGCSKKLPVRVGTNIIFLIFLMQGTSKNFKLH